ncbi:hypothetical protein [Tepidimicrobium xylanilyticum]|uniref:Phage major capsid protein, HK97 family n=1 Tax=Tepidimicrobium xylanilyticum TaxID=1123352 RepID=A0A1H3EJ66_9FIRM|nr:hypothetical protein [Tepidimicrobium xylanilyticum]GMG96249.1 hypothetical protein EN5CB1_10750 [Tepidimicrobium xylanilyticum]SDX78660.1 hypothetical protein SAMN05660923_02930 [Tepidimicrobium xylanilyticum]
MNLNNKQVIQKGRTMVTGQQHGMLNPEQSKRFMQMIFDDSSFLGQFRHEMRVSTKGSIEKLGIGRRLLRKKAEGEMPLESDYAEPVLGAVPYSTVDIVLGAEITEKFIRENIEREGFEDIFMEMIAKQVRVDMLDLAFNGDTDYTGPDAEFITILDGIVKQLGQGSNILDASTLGNGKFVDDIFTTALKILPSKYFNKSTYKWIANNKTYITWLEYLKNKETTAGDMAILNGDNLNPLNVEWAIVPNFPDGKIILADPSNFTTVTTYNIKLRKTIEGKEAVMRDTRYYAVHLDMDQIIMEKEAAVMIENVPETI